MFPTLHYWTRTYIQTALLSFFLSAVLMPVAIWLLRRFRFLDPVSEEKLHAQPVPRGGGVVIFIAFAVAVLLPNYRENPMKGILIGAFICLLVGAADDFLGGISARFKFITLVAVTLIMAYFGVYIHLFPWYPVNIVVTVLWIVGVTSAFNGTDNMDGLASGIAVIVAAMFFLIALDMFWMTGTENRLSWFGLLSVGLIGANLGFLLYNFKPAKIFMGDSGSFFLGFTLAALSVMGEWASNPLIACTIPVLILGVPLFDFAYILITRIIKGETRTLRAVIEHCALDHLSHRLCWIGFSQRKAVLFIYFLCIALGVTGILLRNSARPLDSALAIMQGIIILFIVVILMATAASRHMRYIHEESARLAEWSKDAPHQLRLPLDKK